MRQAAKDIQTYIKQFVDDTAANLLPYIAQGRFNNEFIRGRQNKRVNVRTYAIEDLKQDPEVYTERKIFNRMLPIYLTRYGILTQNMPILGIRPVSNTSKEVADSIKVNNFFADYCLDINFKQAYQLAVKHADVYGIEWIKTGIDWSQGDKILDIETSIGEKKGVVELREGRPFLTPIPIHEIFVDSLQIESMDDVNELVHRRAFPVDYIKKRWNIAEVVKEDITETRLPVYPRYTSTGFQVLGGIEYAYVYEYYKKPDALYPDGRYTIVCNDKILYDGILPYVNGPKKTRQIPFDFLNVQSIPHHLIGVTVYSQLIPIQETYNSVKNRYLEYVNHIAIGQMYYWEGSLVNKNNFTTKPGKLIGLKRNAKKPEPVLKDKLSMEFMTYLRALEDDMLITAGLSQMAAYGSAKSNVRTDGVVDKLSESDENKLVNALDNISNCLIGVFKKILYLEQQREELLQTELSKGTKVEYTFKYELSDVNAEQVSVINRDFLMQSDQARDKKLQQLMTMGMFSPAANQLSYMSKIEMLNALDANFLKDTMDPIERATHDLCDDENASLLKGGNVPAVEEFHVHAQHIVEHNLFRISPTVRRLEKDDLKAYKSLQQAISMHIEGHQKLMQAKQQANVFGNAKAMMGTAGQPRPKSYSVGGNPSDNRGSIS